MAVRLPYRKGVVCVIFKGNRFLLVQRPGWKENWWKFPQGGVNNSETDEEAVARELCEELNISKFKILAKSKYIYQYDWPTKIIAKNYNKWKGQRQSFYFVKCLGRKSEITITEPSEICRFRLVEKDELSPLISHRAKVFEGYREVVEKVLKEFEEMRKWRKFAK